MTQCSACGRTTARRGIWIAAWLLSLISAAMLATRTRTAADIVFFGDSLTEEWTLPGVNYGGYGNTTEQMLSRFNEVVDGQFTRAVILAGTNDVLKGVDPDKTIANLHEMIKQATQARLQTVVGTLPPIYKDGGKYQAAVDSLNDRIRQEVQSWNDAGTKVILVDYNKPLRGMKSAYSDDGVHLRERGYLLMDIQLLRKINPFTWKGGVHYPDATPNRVCTTTPVAP